MPTRELDCVVHVPVTWHGGPAQQFTQGRQDLAKSLKNNLEKVPVKDDGQDHGNTKQAERTPMDAALSAHRAKNFGSSER